MRRIVAILVLIAVAGSMMESVVGAVRDSEVHHEADLLAVVHQQSRSVEHEHGDFDRHAGEQQGEDHDHGTAGDHCTHVHSAAVIPSIPSALPTTTAELDLTEPTANTGDTRRQLPHPPRA